MNGEETITSNYGVWDLKKTIIGKTTAAIGRHY
jgi:hypothetical protein